MKFETADGSDMPMEFTGFTVERDHPKLLIINQHRFLCRLEQHTLEAESSMFRSMRMRLAWLSNSRPDFLFEISQLAQVTESPLKDKKRDHIKALNRAVKFATQYRTPLQIPKLDKDTISVVGFSDASFARNAYMSSQIGYLVMLIDGSDNCVPIFFKS